MSTETVRRPGPSLRLSLSIVAVGVVVGAFCGFMAIRAFVRLLNTPAHTTPSEFTIDAGRGTYAVYERTGSSGFGDDTFLNRRTALTPNDVTVTDPDGAEVPTRPTGVVNETITRGGSRYEASVRFTTTRGGRHAIAVRGATNRVIVARTLGSTFRSVGGYVLGASAALVALLTGVVLWIVGVVRRRNAAPPGPPGPYVPMPAVAPGWYPDPTDPRWWRYHDGRGWTPHTAPRQT